MKSEFYSQEENKFINRLIYINKIVFFEKDDPLEKLELDCFTLTSLGMEILALLKYDFDEEYYALIIKTIKNKGFVVKSANIIKEENGKINYQLETTIE